MPTYQYACSGCGHQFETVQSFSDDSLTTCPDCGQDQLRKVYGSVGVVFKGSGFYRTDSRAEGKRSGGSTGTTAAKTENPDKPAKAPAGESKKPEASKAPASSGTAAKPKPAAPAS